MRELRRWPSIADMSPQSHCDDKEDGHIVNYKNGHIINYKNALTCKVGTLKKAIAETSIRNGCFNEIDPLYQKALKYHHHTENYKESLAQDITPFGLQLKKKVAISAISPDFDSQ